MAVVRLESMMRNASIAVAAGLTLVCLSTGLHGQARQEPIDPRSVQMLAEGNAARATGNLDAATDLIEGAAAVDPRNRDAFVALAQIASGEGLSGKAIGLYRDALTLDPNDTAALRGQGEALLAKGATRRAEDNLARIRTLCHGECADASTLAAAVGRGSPVAATTVAAPETVTPR